MPVCVKAENFTNPQMPIRELFWIENSAGQIVKERIEDGANEKAVLILSVTALSFASISIFPG